MMFFHAQNKTVKTELVELTEGLVAHWPLHSNADDISSGNRNGTISGATNTTGRLNTPNTAIEFGAGDVINLPNVVSFLTQNEVTVSAWINPNQIRSDRDQFVFTKHTSGRHITLSLDRNTNRLRCHSFTGSKYQSIASNNIVPINSWTHIIYTFDSQLKASLYINGILDNERIYSVAPDNTSDTMTIGSFLSSYHFYGKLSDIRLYNRVLTQPEIELLSQ